MSLARIALRIAVVQALRGRTLVGQNVLDSRIGLIEVGKDGGAMTDQTKPFVAVYTGSGETDVRDLRSLTGNGSTWLVLELGVTAKMAVPDEDTDESHIVPGIPATDDALEMMLDLIVREIGNALTDPDNVWAEVYRSLVCRITKVEVEPLRSDGGQRLAARQIRIAVDLLDDPVTGERTPEDGILGSFLTELDKIPGAIAASQAEMIRDAIGPVDERDWKNLQRRRGLTTAELRALGLGPVEQDEPRETPIFSSADVGVDGAGRTTVSLDVG